MKGTLFDFNHIWMRQKFEFPIHGSVTTKAFFWRDYVFMLNAFSHFFSSILKRMTRKEVKLYERLLFFICLFFANVILNLIIISLRSWIWNIYMCDVFLQGYVFVPSMYQTRNVISVLKGGKEEDKKRLSKSESTWKGIFHDLNTLPTDIC